jgi:hypothetical protein
MAHRPYSPWTREMLGVPPFGRKAGSPSLLDSYCKLGVRRSGSIHSVQPTVHVESHDKR